MMKKKRTRMKRGRKMLFSLHFNFHYHYILVRKIFIHSSLIALSWNIVSSILMQSFHGQYIIETTNMYNFNFQLNPCFWLELINSVVRGLMQLFSGIYTTKSQMFFNGIDYGLLRKLFISFKDPFLYKPRKRGKTLWAFVWFFFGYKKFGFVLFAWKVRGCKHWFWGLYELLYSWVMIIIPHMKGRELNYSTLYHYKRFRYFIDCWLGILEYYL